MNLSLCCISIMLQEQGYKFQKITYTRFKSLPLNEAMRILSSRIHNNLVVTNKIIQHCYSLGIKGYRMSSDLMPILSHPETSFKLADLPDVDLIYRAVDDIKTTIHNTGIRVSAHPGEYITLTSKNPTAVNNSIRDLESHAFLFDLLGLPCNYNSPLNIHCRQDGDPAEVSSEFIKNFHRLSDSVRKRLVVEVNDNVDGTWTISNLIKYFYQSVGIPITFDTLHHSLCHGNMSAEDAFHAAYATWPVIPIFHYSEGVNGTKRHADYAVNKPNDYGKPVYWDVELKQKDLAIKQLLESH